MAGKDLEEPGILFRLALEDLRRTPPGIGVLFLEFLPVLPVVGPELLPRHHVQVQLGEGDLAAGGVDRFDGLFDLFIGDVVKLVMPLHTDHVDGNVLVAQQPDQAEHLRVFAVFPGCNH